MAINFIAGAGANAAGDHMKDITTPEDSIQMHQLHALHALYMLVQEMHDFFKHQTLPERFDIFKIITLYKQGQGGNWIPLKENTQYLRVYALVPTAVLVTSPLGPPAIVTIPAVTLPALWLPWDFPDGSSFMLDATATANQMNIFTRLTDTGTRE